MGRDDALKVHFGKRGHTGHTYHMHAGTRYQALADTLAKLDTATGPPDIKNLITVLTYVEFHGPYSSPASHARLFALLSPAEVQRHVAVMRGAIAAGVAWLLSTNMEIPQIKRWLDEEIKRRALDFTAHNAMRWYRDCSKGAVHNDTLGMFRAFRPKPSLSPTEAVAKEQMAKILDRAVVMKAGPLTRWAAADFAIHPTLIGTLLLLAPWRQLLRRQASGRRPTQRR